MNRIHRTVWSKARNALIVVSEVSASPGKGAQGGSVRKAGQRSRGSAPSRLGHSLAVASLVVALPLAHALPQSGQVTSGSATIVQGVASTTIVQTSQNASMNWSSFNIGKSEAVVFQQPNASAIALNRIADTSASQILGTLNANGQVFLVNPNGILFGAGAQVSVGALVASTLDLNNSALTQASKTFSSAATGSITNLGKIQAAQGGYVALIANQVSNQGRILAPGGSVALGAGSQVTLQFADNQLLGLTVDRNTLGNLADNQQLIQADGGQIILSAGAHDSVLAGVVNNSGRLQAQALQNVGGVITLVGGQIQQLGAIDVSAPNSGNAGSVRVYGASVLDGGQIDASSATGQGGQVSLTAVGGLVQTAQAGVTADGAAQGGHITLQGNNVFTSATLSAKGSGAGTEAEAHGGTVDVLSSHQVALQGASLDASGSGSHTGGLIRIGGDFHGANASVTNAATTLVNGASTLRTDGASAQGGGKVVIWSDAKTAYFGAIEARGGEVEVSSRDVLQFAGDVKARQLLLDPKNITVLSGSAASSVAFALVDPNPGANRSFGENTTVLGTTTAGVFTPSDRVVVAVPNDNASRGAVYLYNSATGVLVSTLTGSQANDSVGKSSITALTNGNYVVSSGNWANGGATYAGAATWGSGTTGVSGTVSASNSLVGTQANDSVGGRNVTALSNGNYVVSSSSWANGSATAAGAATWGSGATGVSGIVSASNSLVGSQSGDAIGIYGIKPLTNGNYVVESASWANGSATGAGAVTWGSGTAGISGVVSASNSLVGSHTGDAVGKFGVTALTNGNYVVSSTQWANGSASGAGAATWGSGTSGVSGAISVSNSLVGSQAGDQVGGNEYGGVRALTNGNYVISSPNWANVSATSAGAATWGSGTSGVSGVVSASNSLVGIQTGDTVGIAGVTALTNGNYVVDSLLWSNRGVAYVGAATWGSGTAGVSGAVSASNSLVGSRANDAVGSSGITALTNGNYVVSSNEWANGGATSAGAVTWGNGASGVRGPVSASNSLVGSHSYDSLGLNGVVALTNGNYVVSSNHWANGGVADVGAVTWGSGTSGISGAVSSSNSLVGSQFGDDVGNFGVTALTNGNYVVRSYTWNNGGVAGAGAATWGSGTAGVSGAVSASNSLVGSHAHDMVGVLGVTALSNGNYVVSSMSWANGDGAAAGAATWGSGTAGVSGAVSASNSLVGSHAKDYLGSGGITALTNGNYVVSSANWANGAATNSGAATWGSGTSGVSGAVSASNSLINLKGDAYGSVGISALPNGRYVVSSHSFNSSAGQVLVINSPAGNQYFANSSGLNLNLDPVNLQNLLASGTAVTLQASTDLTIASPITVAGSTGGALTLQAGRSILFNANVSTANGNLTAVASDPGAVAAQRDLGSGKLVIASGVSLNVGTGIATLAGQVFVNNSGAGALQTTGAGRWAVWSTDPANDTRGGLTYDFKQYNANYGSTALAQPTGNGFLYSLAPMLTATLTGSVSKVYDASTNAQLSGVSYSTVGSVDGDTVALSPLPANGSFDTRHVGIGKTVTATGLSVASVSNGAAKVYGYAVGANASGAIGTVTQAGLTVTGVAAIDRSYDATKVVMLGGSATVTPLAGDAVNVAGTGTGTIETKTAGLAKPVTVTGYTLSGINSGNYTVLEPTGLTANIKPLSLQVTGVKAVSRVFDWTRFATLGGTAVVTVLALDSVTVSGPGKGLFADKAVGNDKPVTVTGYTLGGPDAASYVVVQPTGLKANIYDKVVPPQPQALSRSAKGPAPGSGGTDRPGESPTTGITGMDVEFVTNSVEEPQK